MKMLENRSFIKQKVPKKNPTDSNIRHENYSEYMLFNLFTINITCIQDWPTSL